MKVKMRYFIFFYRCQNESHTMYGQYGFKAEKLPPLPAICEGVALTDTDFTAGQVAILGFNEVSKDDYNSFFDK